MQIRLRYFASLREIAGKNEEMLDFPANITIAEVRTFLLERYSGLEKALARAICAVNHQYVPAETVVHEGDEVVFIPPVGGGRSSEEGKRSWNH